MSDKNPTTAATSATITTALATQSPFIANHYFAIEFLSGAIGGIISRTATAPIDRLRTFLQVYSVEHSRNKLKLRFIWNQMILEGSYVSLWRGNLVNILKTAPENAIKLVTYEQFKQYLRTNNPSKTLSVQDKFLAGSAAGFIAQFTLYPLKTVKVVMNLRNTNEYKSIADCIAKLYSRHGVRAFYRGLVPNSLAIMPCSGIDLAAYETLKHKYSEYCNKPEPNIFERLIIGNVSSGLGNLVVYPMIMLRTRLQSNRNLSETTINLFVHIWKTNGVYGMYRGFLLHALKIGPCASISYITFEYFNKLFNINSLI